MDPNYNEVTIERLEKVSVAFCLVMCFLTKSLVFLKTNATFPLIAVLPELHSQRASLTN